MTQINYSTAAMLFNPNIRAIKCSYKLDNQGSPKQLYLFKTLDASISVGDYVAVPADTRHKLTVVRVEEVDVEIDFDDMNLNLKWIVDVVDVASYNKVLVEEKNWVSAFKAAQAQSGYSY